MRIMWKPKYFHEMITNSVNITIVVSPSQSWIEAPQPDAAEHAVDQADPGWSSSRKTMPVTASERTYGRKNSSRNTRPAREPPVEHDGERRARTGSGCAATGRRSARCCRRACRNTSFDRATW